MPAKPKLIKRLVLLLGGVFGVGLVALMAALPQPAQAIDPTPTPVPPADSACRLEQGIDCEFGRFPAKPVSTLIMKTNPPLDAQEVPTNTLVSVTFTEAMAGDTINRDTFYVQQGDTWLTGEVVYLEAGKIAGFYPDEPFAPDTHYTATLTTDVRDRFGNPLPQEFVWSFTTFVEPVIFGDDLSATGANVGGGMYVYIGDVHTHSGYDDTDPNHNYLPGTPVEAFAVAELNGLDFLALTGHDRYLNATRWQDILDKANGATVNGSFIGLRGFEYTNDFEGHLTVLNTNDYVSWTDSRYRNLVDFYAWLVAQSDSIGEFNHPSAGFNFNNFAYYGDVDQKITLREIVDVNQTLLSLNKGWHVGTLLNSDTHVGNWGSQRYMGVVAPALSKAAISEALAARRTFYVSPYGQRMAVVMRANGTWMGSAIPNTGTINFTVTIHDPDYGSKPLNLRLYDNGVRVASVRLQGAPLLNWYPQLPARLGHYYYVEAYHDGWVYPAYTSPIWVEQPPVADAGNVVYAPQSGSVMLDGSASWDPDGDSLAYQWQQLSGVGGIIDPDDKGQVAFYASSNLGETVVELTVTDTGSLMGTDTVSVISTDKPILSIVADGPETAGPGELITYTLTITNRGVSTATQVVVNNVLPEGATYVGGSGGTLLPGNIVSWTLGSLAKDGGTTQVQYAVTASSGIVNKEYNASCGDCIAAIGTVVVKTNIRDIYLPIIMK